MCFVVCRLCVHLKICTFLFHNGVERAYSHQSLCTYSHLLIRHEAWGRKHYSTDGDEFAGFKGLNLKEGPEVLLFSLSG